MSNWCLGFGLVSPWAVFDNLLQVISYLCLGDIEIVFYEAYDVCIDVVHVVKGCIQLFIVVSGADSIDVGVIYTQCGV